MGQSFSNGIVDSDLFFPAPASTYTKDSKGIILIRSETLKVEIPVLYVKPKVTLEESCSLFADICGSNRNGNAKLKSLRKVGSPSVEGPRGIGRKRIELWDTKAKSNKNNKDNKDSDLSNNGNKSVDRVDRGSSHSRGISFCDPATEYFKIFKSNDKIPITAKRADVRRFATETRTEKSVTLPPLIPMRIPKHSSPASTALGIVKAVAKPNSAEADKTSSYREVQTYLKTSIEKKMRSGVLDKLIDNRKFCVLYFHANACDLGMTRSPLQLLADSLQVSFLAVEYPGYGLLDKYSPSTSGVDFCGLLAYRYIVKNLKFKPENIILNGRSIGCGPAALLASHLCRRGHKLGGLALISPYKSISGLVADFVPLSDLIVKNQWNVQKAVSSLDLLPLCVVHGAKDEVINCTHGAKVLEASKAPSCLRVGHFPPEATHNCLFLTSDVMAPFQRFLVAVSAYCETRDAHPQLFSLKRTQNASATGSGSGGSCSPQSSERQRQAPPIFFQRSAASKSNIQNGYGSNRSDRSDRPDRRRTVQQDTSGISVTSTADNSLSQTKGVSGACRTKSSRTTASSSQFGTGSSYLCFGSGNGKITEEPEPKCRRHVSDTQLRRKERARKGRNETTISRRSRRATNGNYNKPVNHSSNNLNEASTMHDIPAQRSSSKVYPLVTLINRRSTTKCLQCGSEKTSCSCAPSHINTDSDAVCGRCSDGTSTRSSLKQSATAPNGYSLTKYKDKNTGFKRLSYDSPPARQQPTGKGKSSTTVLLSRHTVPGASMRPNMPNSVWTTGTASSTTTTNATQELSFITPPYIPPYHSRNIKLSPLVGF